MTSSGDVASHIDAFERDGAVPLRGVVDEAWVSRLRAAIERDIETPGPFHHSYESAGRGRFHGNLRTWESDPELAEFCLRSKLPELAAGLLRSPKINLFYDQIFVKEPGTVERTRWHNDQPYWPIRGRQVLSFWIALDAVTAETGAVEFVAGSHRWNRWFQPQPFGRTPALSEYEPNPHFEEIPDIERQRASYDIVHWELEPGDAIAFHGLTVHGAGGNRRKNRRRRGYAVRYTGDDVRYCEEPGSNPHLRHPHLRGGELLDSEQFPVVWQS